MPDPLARCTIERALREFLGPEVVLNEEERIAESGIKASFHTTLEKACDEGFIDIPKDYGPAFPLTTPIIITSKGWDSFKDRF